MTHELSIAIVLHNSAGALAECLRSIQPVIEQGWAELLAVDNASPDRSVEIVQTEIPRARLVRLESNRGFAAGANAAMERATARYWLLLNPDVRVPDGGLESMVQWMDDHPQVGAASPDIYGVDGHWESPGRATPSILRALLESSRAHRVLPARVRGRILHGPYWLGGDQVDAGWVPGTAMFVRREAARAAGPLREDLFMYGEDIEWCWRIRRAGWRIGVSSATTFIHATSTSVRTVWDDEERERRIAEGIDRACREMFGVPRARASAAATALSLWAEAHGRRRTSQQRELARRSARTWWNLARDR